MTQPVQRPALRQRQLACYIALNLDLTTALDPRITFTRATTGSYYNSAGLLTQAAINAPRFDYDPVTLQPKGLLIEESRTNLLLNSLINGTNLSTQNVTVTAQAYTLSFYGTGTITLSGAYAGGLVGSGDYPAKSKLTFTPTAGTLTVTVSGTVQYAQLEAGPFNTSFIPTVASQVTRAADVAVMTGTNFSSWYNQSEGSFYVEFDNPVTGNKRIFAACDGSTANRVMLGIVVGSSGNIFYTVTQGGTAQVNNLMLKSNLGTGSDAFYKASIGYKQDDFAGSVNAEAVATDSSGTVPIVSTQLTIGVAESSKSAWLNGHIKRITYYKKRLSNRLLQYLTR